jgi:ketosteroid isomerase-like protein
MKRSFFLSFLTLCVNFTPQAQAPTKPDLWMLAQECLQAFERIDFDKMGTYLHDSVSFFDIGSSAKGKWNVINNWKKSFDPKPERIHFEVREHFVSGSFVVMDVFYEAVTKVQNENTVVNIEVITVIQFKDGKIIMLNDYPDFSGYGRQLASQLQNMEPTPNPNRNVNLTTTKKYYQAYAKWDVSTLTTFYHDSIEFKDLTAKDMFKGGTYEHNGKEDVSRFWSGIFKDTPLEYVDMIVHNMFTAGDFVMVNSTLSMVLPPSWTVNAPGKVYVSLPIKTVLRFKEGKIISQYDFADYNLYNKQMNAQMP